MANESDQPKGGTPTPTPAPAPTPAPTPTPAPAPAPSPAPAPAPTEPEALPEPVVVADPTADAGDENTETAAAATETTETSADPKDGEETSAAPAPAAPAPTPPAPPAPAAPAPAPTPPAPPADTAELAPPLAPAPKAPAAEEEAPSEDNEQVQTLKIQLAAWAKAVSGAGKRPEDFAGAAKLALQITQFVIRYPKVPVLNALLAFFEENIKGVCDAKVRLKGSTTLGMSDEQAVGYLFNMFGSLAIKSTVRINSSQTIAVLKKPEIINFYDRKVAFFRQQQSAE